MMSIGTVTPNNAYHDSFMPGDHHNVEMVMNENIPWLPALAVLARHPD